MILLYVFCLLILFEVGSQEILAKNNNFGKPLLLIHQEDYLSNISENSYKGRYGEYGLTSTETYSPTRFLKGYSLKTPVFPDRSLRNGSHLNFRGLGQGVRAKRGVGHLYNMISCATGCNPLSYKGYGCFCGLLGSGYPVDGIDSCCKNHDWCYDAANCPMYLEYFIPYYWKCWYKTPFCASDHAELGAPGSCADKLCECDRVLSVCLKRYTCPSRRAVCKRSPFGFLRNAFKLFT